MKYLVLIIVVLLVSCGKKSQSEIDRSKSLNVNLIDSKDKNQLELNIVDLKPLQMNEEFDGFSGHLRIKSYQDLFFVFDLDFQQLYCFDSNGNLRYSIGGRGKGANELINAIDFTFLNGEISFLISTGSNSFIAKFDTLNNKISTSKIDYSTSAFEQINYNEYLLYTGWNNERVPFRLLKWNRELEQDQSTFFYHEYSQPKVPLEAYSLEKEGENIFFFDPMTPFIYQINSNMDVIPFVTFNLGTYELDDEYWELSAASAQEIIFKHGFYACKYFLMSGNYLVMLGDFVGDNGNLQEYVLTHINYKQNEIKSRVLQQGTIDEVLINVFSLKNNQFISLGDGYTMNHINGDYEELSQFDILDDRYYLVYSEIAN